MQTGGLIILAIGVLVLLTWLLRQQRKDRKAFTQQLNRDYRAKKEEEGDIDIDEVKH